MLVFIILAFIGFAFLVISLIFGEIFDVVGDVAHDIVVEHEISMDHPEAGGPSPFSIRIIAAFLTGFGASGAIASYYKMSWIASSGIGLCFGLLTGAIVYSLISAMYKQQAQSGVSLSEMINSSGVVTVAIPKDGIGQVSVVLKSSQSEHLAKSEDGSEVKDGTNVKIVRVVGGQLIVKPLTG